MNNFKEDLIKILGLENLPEDEKMEIILSCGKIIQQNIYLRILDQLNEKDKKEFNDFLGKEKDEEKILNFLKKKLPQLDEIVNEEIEKFKLEAKEFMEKVLK